MDCISLAKEFANALCLALKSFSGISPTLFLNSYKKRENAGVQIYQARRMGRLGGVKEVLVAKPGVKILSEESHVCIQGEFIGSAPQFILKHEEEETLYLAFWLKRV